jgi:hypothetical protein
VALAQAPVNKAARALRKKRRDAIRNRASRLVVSKGDAGKQQDGQNRGQQEGQQGGATKEGGQNEETRR